MLVVGNGLIHVNARPTDDQPVRDLDQQTSDTEADADERYYYEQAFPFDPSMVNQDQSKKKIPGIDSSNSKQKATRQSCDDFTDFAETVGGTIPSGNSTEAGLNVWSAGADGVRPNSFEFTASAGGHDSANASSTQSSPRATAAPTSLSPIVFTNVQAPGAQLQPKSLFNNAGDAGTEKTNEMVTSQPTTATFENTENIEDTPLMDGNIIYGNDSLNEVLQPDPGHYTIEERKISKQGQPVLVLGDEPGAHNKEQEADPKTYAMKLSLSEWFKQTPKPVIVIAAVSGLFLVSIIAGKIIVKKVAAWRDKLADSENDDLDEQSERASLLEAMNG